MADTLTENEIRFDSVEVLSKAKAQAESRVKFIRSLREDGEIEEKDLRKIQLLYSEVRADVNAGLDRVLVELEITGSKGATEPYDRVAARAAKRATDFLESSDEMILGDDRGAVEAGIKLADSMTKAFVDIWKTLRGEKSERHEQLIRRIESLKWEQFSEIK